MAPRNTKRVRRRGCRAPDGRELEIAVLVAQGCATKNIAYRLQISEWTVSTYLRRIFAKLESTVAQRWSIAARR